MRKAFLAPWDPRVHQAWLYALADAQRTTSVQLHHAICVITHHHVTTTPQKDNLPLFTGKFHHDVSAALNTLLALERYDQPRELFDGRRPHYMRLIDAAAQATQIGYERNNCVAAGLVLRPEDMPGDRFDFNLWRGVPLRVERPAFYFESSRPEVLELRFTPPPLLLRAFGGDVERLIYHMRRLCEHAARRLRAARSGSVLGARGVQRLHPWSEPRTLRESGGRRIPSFRIGARGIDGRLVAEAAAAETHEFRCEHEQARLARLAGDAAARFPFGTYAMRTLHAAPVEPQPKPGALVTRPGPLAWDDYESDPTLEHDPALSRDALRQSSHALLTEAREAFDEESEALVNDDELLFDSGPTRTNARNAEKADGAEDADRADDEATRPVVTTRHRFARPLRQGSETRARRIVTLRDARRGRPPSGRHGGDPPG